MRNRRTTATILSAALLAGVGCSRGGDGERGQERSAPAAHIDTADQPRQERIAELEAQQRRVQPQPEGALTKAVSGTIVTTSDHEIVVRRDDGEEPDLRLRLAPRTPITVAGRDGGRDDLKEGAHVRASFERVKNDEVATRIEVTAEGGGK
ncbi:hypothetical protein [Anaeromyxobacter sp. Fw109-5]|uniref:hypothetical protein n=1 Tax=Anaeromyxobacter sp. (strain Fw109-5) TaxID=404589 RepID=UPI000158A4C4|nr:hypothetical protein [Anaeromyxobacter sp. Fw109-5]ABS27273.1 hypothetical protein Anae109_3077 [Anaeromyxobacter sp. Fw109-5]